MYILMMLGKKSDLLSLMLVDKFQEKMQKKNFSFLSSFVSVLITYLFVTWKGCFH